MAVAITIHAVTIAIISITLRVVTVKNNNDMNGIKLVIKMWEMTTKIMTVRATKTTMTITVITKK